MYRKYAEKDVVDAIICNDIATLQIVFEAPVYRTEVRDGFLLTAVSARSVEALALVMQEGTSKPGRMQAAHALTDEAVWSLPMAEMAVMLYEEGIDSDENLPFFCKNKLKDCIEKFIEKRYAPCTANPPVWRDIDDFNHQDHALADLHEQAHAKLRAQSAPHAESAEMNARDEQVHFNDRHPLYRSFSEFIKSADHRLGLTEGGPRITRIMDILGRYDRFGAANLEPAG